MLIASCEEPTPTDLPVQQPSKFEFRYQSTYREGARVELPPTLLALAAEVIE
jgi:hypothetical protein